MKIWETGKALRVLVACIAAYIILLYYVKSNQSVKNEEILGELASKLNDNVEKDTLIITISNYGFRYMTLNWIQSLNRNNYTRLVVFCFDQQLVDFLDQRGYTANTVLIPRDWLDYDISANFTNFKERNYVRLVQSKTNIWLRLVKNGYRILFSDSDTVWLSPHVIDHVKFCMNKLKSHMAFMVDQEGKMHNTGFFYAAPTTFVIRTFERVLAVQRMKPATAMEQYVLHNILRHRSELYDPRIACLDDLLYASGQVRFRLRLNTKFNITPLVVHTNYLFGYDAKIRALVHGGYWYLNQTGESLNQ